MYKYNQIFTNKTFGFTNILYCINSNDIRNNFAGRNLIKITRINPFRQHGLFETHGHFYLIKSDHVLLQIKLQNKYMSIHI